MLCCHGYCCHALYTSWCVWHLLDYTAQCSCRHCVLAEVMCAPHEYSLTDLKCAAPPPPPPSPAFQDLHQRAKRELSRQNTTVILAVCKVVREMRGMEQPYSSLLAELPSRNFNRYSVLVEKFEALVRMQQLFSSHLMCCLCAGQNTCAELCLFLFLSEFGSTGRVCHFSEGVTVTMCDTDYA